MINGFEKETRPLNKEEKEEYLPVIVNILYKKLGKQNAITNKQIKSILIKIGLHKACSARIRKVINHIRLNKIIPNLLSNSKGYYVSICPIEIKLYKESLLQRAEAIKAVANTY